MGNKVRQNENEMPRFRLAPSRLPCSRKESLIRSEAGGHEDMPRERAGGDRRIFMDAKQP